MSLFTDLNAYMNMHVFFYRMSSCYTLYLLAVDLIYIL